MFDADTPKTEIEISNAACPCGSGLPYAQCCGPCHDGSRPARTAEALMRSRYSAFVRRDYDYLIASLAPEKRPAANELEADRQDFLEQQKNIHWQALRILETRKGKRKDRQGHVLFEAVFTEQEQTLTLRENSRFRQAGGHWYYVDGDVEMG